jgi:hypothetical protein
MKKPHKKLECPCSHCSEWSADKIAELEAQNAELHRDGMEPRAVLRSRIAELESALRDIMADCESNWISAQMIAGIARKAVEGK